MERSSFNKRHISNNHNWRNEQFGRTGGMNSRKKHSAEKKIKRGHLGFKTLLLTENIKNLTAGFFDDIRYIF